jgi:hypothetical protein
MVNAPRLNLEAIAGVGEAYRNDALEARAMLSRLWILEAIDTNARPWLPPYDTIHAMVVEASTESEAREQAAAKRQDEGADVWRDPNLTSCENLKPIGEDRVIMRAGWGS